MSYTPEEQAANPMTRYEKLLVAAAVLIIALAAWNDAQDPAVQTSSMQLTRYEVCEAAGYTASDADLIACAEAFGWQPDPRYSE